MRGEGWTLGNGTQAGPGAASIVQGGGPGLVLALYLWALASMAMAGLSGAVRALVWMRARYARGPGGSRRVICRCRWAAGRRRRLHWRRWCRWLQCGDCYRAGRAAPGWQQRARRERRIRDVQKAMEAMGELNRRAKGRQQLLDEKQAMQSILWIKQQLRAMTFPMVLLIAISVLPGVTGLGGDASEIGPMAHMGVGVGAAGVWLQQLIGAWDEWQDKEDEKLEENDVGDEEQHSTHDWTGDCLQGRGENAGLRLACLNVNRKLMTHSEGTEPYIDLLLKEGNKLDIDILVVQEPGGLDGKEEAIRLAAERNERHAVVLLGKGTSGGCVVFMAAAWAAVAEDHFAVGKDGRCGFIEFVAAEHRGGEPLGRLLLACAYGYNDGSLPQHRSFNLRDRCEQTIKQYRKKYKTASAVLVGDLNAAIDSELDTDGYNVLERDAPAHGTPPPAR